MSSILFSPISIGSLDLANRILVAPMCQYSATDGIAGDWHLIHYGHLAQSGAGLLIFEATAVSPEGRISPHDLGLWSGDCASALADMLKRIGRFATTPLAVQLAHAGRKASTSPPWEGDGVLTPDAGGWQTLAPSDLPYREGMPAPLALDEAGLEKVRRDFEMAAVRAEEIGFRAIEVHAAHGYLLHQFLSPLSNAREDAYGGSLENRMRFPLEVIRRVRKATYLPVGVRISGSDWALGGWNVDESCILARELTALGCAYIHVSGGGLTPEQQLRVGPGYQVDMAARVRADSFLPTVAVGLITDPVQAETIVASGQADMVALGRGMLFDPRWPWRAASVLGASVAAPPQYWRAEPYGAKGLFRK